MLNLIATPFGYLLKFCYDFTQSYAVALILFTLLFKLILLPFNIKQQKASVAQARIKPKEKAIRKRYEGRTDAESKVALSNDLMAMYKEENVNAAGGCLPMLIQIPIIWVLWEIIKNPLQYICRLPAAAITDIKAKIYAFLSSGVLNPSNTAQSVINAAYKAETAAAFNPSEIEVVTILRDNPTVFSGFLSDLGYENLALPNFTLFGSIDLAETPTLSLSLLILIPICTALFQFLSTKVIQFFGPKPDLSTPEAQSAAQSMKTMNIVFPILTFFLALRLPAVIGLYWIYQSIFGMIIQVALYKSFPVPVFSEEEYARVEAEVNKDFVYIPAPTEHKRSLHHIDDEDEENEDEVGPEDTENEESEDEENDGTEITVTERRRYDKNGNKIRSLHYIDEDDEEIPPVETEKEEAEENTASGENNDSDSN